MIMSTLAEMDERVRAVTEKKGGCQRGARSRGCKKGLHVCSRWRVMFGPTVGLKRAVKIGGVGVMLLKMKAGHP